MSIKQRIKELGLTQTEIARRLGVHKSTVSRILNGEITMSAVMALKLSRLLQLSVDKLLELLEYPDVKNTPVASK